MSRRCVFDEESGDVVELEPMVRIYIHVPRAMLNRLRTEQNWLSVAVQIRRAVAAMFKRRDNAREFLARVREDSSRLRSDQTEKRMRGNDASDVKKTFQ